MGSQIFQRSREMKSCFIFALATALFFAGCAHLPPIITPKLAVLNQQIQANPADAQAYSNRGYTLALLGQGEAARVDLRKAVALKNTAPMHNSAGFARGVGRIARPVNRWRMRARRLSDVSSLV